MSSSKILYPADPIVETILNRIRLRANRGMAQYGESLQDAKKTPTQWLLDASEEMTDAALYLEKVRLEVEDLQYWLKFTLAALHISSPLAHAALLERIPDELLR